MFEKYLIHPGSFRNVKRADKVIGYEIGLRIPYYRGLPMSCVEEITLSVDDDKVASNDMIIVVKGEEFTVSELSTAINHRWEMVDPITVFVKKEGGLSTGKHKINGFVSLRISYQPHSNVGEDEKILELAEEKIVKEGSYEL